MAELASTTIPPNEAGAAVPDATAVTEAPATVAATNVEGPAQAEKSTVEANGQVEGKTEQPSANNAQRTKIIKQLEWYFSEYNLPKDKWLKEETAWPSNGMILLEKLMNFNRMKQYSQEAVVEAVKNSTVLKYLANPDRVGRKEPLPLPDSIASKRKIGDLPSEELAAEATEYYGGRERIRSIYVKGFFPAEEAKLEEIETLFRPYGSQAVRMRRNRDNTFKGSVFVEFKDQEDRDNFMKLENKPVYKNNEMHYETKDGYCERKLMENPQFREQDNRSRGRGRGGFRGRGRGSGRGRGRGRGGNDYRNGRNSDRRSRSPNDRKKDEDWRARRDRDRANDRANDQAKHE